MMGILRNREVLGLMIRVAAAGLLAAAACFALHPAAGVVCLLGCGLIAGTVFRHTRYRYRRIGDLADRLGQIAGGDYNLDLSEFADGELSILQSELQKVTRTLSHQAEKLGRDKRYLADSLSDISHQLKTPLTSLSMLTDLLADPALPEDKRREFLEGIQSGLERIRWLTQALLKLSRLDAGAVVLRREPVSARALLEQALEPMRIPMELKGQVLELDCPAGIVVQGDQNWLAEAVGNIVKNCVEQTPEGGGLSVSCVQNPLYTQITIQDTGPGIDPEDLPHIFERFYRGKHTASDSVGIGLALSKTIFRQQGGDVQAAATPDGARFTVKLYCQPGE